MLKRDANAKFSYREVGFLTKSKRYRFHFGKYQSEREWTESEYQGLMGWQQSLPINVSKVGARTWWIFQGNIWWEDEGYSATEVQALIVDNNNRKQRKVQKAIASISQVRQPLSGLREPIPDDVKKFVWQRDGGKCVKCGSQANLEFDHIIPIALGGVTRQGTFNCCAKDVTARRVLRLLEAHRQIPIYD